MKYINEISISAIITSIIYLLGGWDISLQILLIVIVLDYITGILQAIHDRKLNSIIGLRGIIKKIGYLIVVAIGVIIDRITGETGAIRTLVIYFFVANEGISIIENWGGMGLPLPKKLIKTLEQLKNSNDEEE